MSVTHYIQLDQQLTLYASTHAMLLNQLDSLVERNVDMSWIWTDDVIACSHELCPAVGMVGHWRCVVYNPTTHHREYVRLCTVHKDQYCKFYQSLKPVDDGSRLRRIGPKFNIEHSNMRALHESCIVCSTIRDIMFQHQHEETRFICHKCKMVSIKHNCTIVIAALVRHLILDVNRRIAMMMYALDSVV